MVEPKKVGRSLRLVVKAMITNIISKLHTVSVALIVLMILMEPAPAQEIGFPALDLMVEAGQSYRDGVSRCDTAAIQAAAKLTFTPTSSTSVIATYLPTITCQRGIGRTNK